MNDTKAREWFSACPMGRVVVVVSLRPVIPLSLCGLNASWLCDSPAVCEETTVRRRECLGAAVDLSDRPANALQSCDLPFCSIGYFGELKS